MLDYFFNSEEADLEKSEKKKKLHALLDKYGSVEEIEKNAVGVDGYAYMFANTDDLIDEVLEERRMGRPTTSQERKETSRQKEKLLPDDEDFSLEGLTLTDRQRAALNRLDMNNQLTMIRILREQQGVAKPEARHEEAKAAADERDTVKTTHNARTSYAENARQKQYAANEHAGVKSDAQVENDAGKNDDEQMKRALADLNERRNGGLSFHDIYHAIYENGKLVQNAPENAEGGYVNDSNDHGGPTNMGITQTTLDEYKNKFRASYKSNISLPDDVKDLTKNQAMVILNEMFFRPYNINYIPNEKLARITFDSCMLAGPKMNKAFTDEVVKLTGKSLYDIVDGNAKIIARSERVIPSQVASLVSFLSDKQKTDLADNLLKARMQHHFSFVAEDHSQINNLEGWYERAKSLYSDQRQFDELYLQKRNDFLTKYEDYLTGKALQRQKARNKHRGK